MHRLALLLPLALLAACYQAEGDTVPAAASVRVEGFKDGRYRRPDGVELRVRWNEAERRYDVATADGPTGWARAMPLAQGLTLVQYVDAARLVVAASPQGDDVQLYLPGKSAEDKALKAFGLSLRPGPINALNGPAAAALPYFRELVRAGGLREGERLVRLGD